MMILTVLSRKRKTRYIASLLFVGGKPDLIPCLQTLELIPLYSKISPIDSSLEYTLPSDAPTLSATDENFDFPSTLIIFTETKALDLTNKFRRDADAYYVEAKRSTVSSIAQIPYWMYGVLVVLGWNEAMAVLFNPLYFTFLLIALATTWVSFLFFLSSYRRQLIYH
jgi:hypothetical protein